MKPLSNKFHNFSISYLSTKVQRKQLKAMIFTIAFYFIYHFITFSCQPHFSVWHQYYSPSSKSSFGCFLRRLLEASAITRTTRTKARTKTMIKSDV